MEGINRPIFTTISQTKPVHDALRDAVDAQTPEDAVKALRMAEALVADEIDRIQSSAMQTGIDANTVDLKEPITIQTEDPR